MIKKIFKWIGRVTGVLLILIFLTYIFIYFNINTRVNKTYNFAASGITISADSMSIQAGRHLTMIKGCTDCHGANMAGNTMINSFALGRISARNLTRGKGGLPRNYTVADWMRALEHGIGKNGKPLLFMPSDETTRMTKNDLADIIAYCNQLAPVNNQVPPNKVGPLTGVLTFLGKMPLLSVEKIDHKKQLAQAVDSNNAIAFGSYLSVSCTGCHKADLKGGDPVAPGFPDVPDITSSGHVGRWSQQQFLKALRTGMRPGNKPLKNEEMPWKMTAQYSDKELVSLYAFLSSKK